MIDAWTIALLQGRGFPSGWIIDIWNCHGVLKPQNFAGYGNQSDEILKDAEKNTGKKYTWFDCGYYTVPLRVEIFEKIKKANLTDELAKRLEKVLDWIVYERNNGAINISGFYMVTIEEITAAEKTIQRILIKAEERKACYYLLKNLS